jgi:replicative DNA helicase
MAENAHDLLAEQAMLGAMLAAPTVATECFMGLPAEAYYNQRHAALASVMQDMVAKRIPVDPVTVLQQCQDQGILGKIGGGPYLHSLLASVPTAVNCDYWAEWLSELYARRQLVDMFTRELQRLDALATAGERTGAAEAVTRIRTEMEDALAYAQGSRKEQLTSAYDFLLEEHERRWLVPGLFERQDRLLITGDEGGGKSMLIAQMVYAMAGGLHPFSSAPLPGLDELRVLLVDCENSADQSRRRFRDVAGRVNLLRRTHRMPPAEFTKNVFVEFRTEGINLMSATDVAWLERKVAAATPDVLILGPLYKLHTEDENSGLAARKIVDVIDNIRARHDCMIITEAHAGHAKNDQGERAMRPIGSSLFLRWPEFGFGIRTNKAQPGIESTADFVSWRGMREERAFPEKLRRGHSSVLPWQPDSAYYADLEPEPDHDWRAGE